jgi:hypothetical protein
MDLVTILLHQLHATAVAAAAKSVLKSINGAPMSSARPRSSGSATMVSLLRLLGVSAKHFSWLVSTTVSQKDTTGSATFTSISEYSSRRSCGNQVVDKDSTGGKKASCNV